MFECTALESIKRALNMDSLKRIAAFYEPSSLKEFINSASEEVKERIFSIQNPSIFFELLNPLIELNSLYMPERVACSPILTYKLDESISSKRVSIVSLQSLIMLSDIIDEPILRELLSSFIFLEKRVVERSTLPKFHHPCFDSKNIIANPSYLFKNYDKVLKVFSHSYMEIYDGYQKLLANFAKGFKSTCKKQNEEDLFFQTVNYFLKSFPNQLTVEEALLNKIYANALAFGYVLENRILRAFERSKMLSKEHVKTQTEEAKDKGTQRNSGIQIGRLSFRIVQNNFELNEYEDFFEELGDYDPLKVQEHLMDDDDREVRALEPPILKAKPTSGKNNHQDGYILKISDTLSDMSASTSESSAESGNSKGKRKHRKRRRRNKRKGLPNEVPQEYLNSPGSWHFQNWVYGVSL